MTVGAGVWRGTDRTVRTVVCCAAVAFASSGASAIVVEGMNPLPQPANGYIAQWNGCTAVAVAPNWVLTARHVGGIVGGLCIVRGQWFQAAEIRPHPWLDLQLVRVTETLPGWHGLAPTPTPGTQVVIGGWGATTTGPLDGGNGWNWNGPHVETWGANVLENVGAAMMFRFEAPSAPAWVPHEASLAANDSGAGMFVQSPDGRLLLSGIAVSVSGYGASMYGTSCYCIDVFPVREWILQTTGAPPARTVGEIFAFIALWFAGDAAADFDGSGVVDLMDLFAFITDWFNG